MTATLDDIVAFITPTWVIVAEPYSRGQNILLLHLAGHSRANGWVLPTDKDCTRMKLQPLRQDGYLLVRVNGEFDAELPAKCDRFNWVCCDFALTCPLDSTAKSAIAQFNRSERLDKILSTGESR